jgi:hypothetical protein
LRGKIEGVAEISIKHLKRCNILATPVANKIFTVATACEKRLSFGT